MAPPVITVTRQYGSGGSDIARLVADRLGWELVDNQFVEEVARRAGVPPAEVAQREERAPGLLERLARTLAVASPEMFIAQAAVPRVEQDEATLVKITERAIAEAATHGRVVLVGRGAQAVLGNRPDALHPHVVASKPFRMELAVERLGAGPAPGRARPPPRRRERRRARRPPPPGTRPAAPSRRTRKSRTPSPDRAAGRGRASATWCS